MSELRCESCWWRRDYGRGVEPWRQECPDCGGRVYAVDGDRRDPVPARSGVPGQLDLFDARGGAS